MIHKTYQVSMEVAGDTALWTRPDTGDSPCSYPAPTYSAVRGLFESILWGPAVRIIPRKVELCSAPQYHSYATNYGGPLRKSSLISKDNNYQLFATVLTGVCYRLYADVIPNPNKEKLPDRAREWDRRTTSPGHAYQEMFNRRLLRGQSYMTPFLGWSESSTPSRPILPSWSGAAKHGRGAAGISLHFPLTSRRTCIRWRLPVF